MEATGTTATPGPSATPGAAAPAVSEQPSPSKAIRDMVPKDRARAIFNALDGTKPAESPAAPEPEKPAEPAKAEEPEGKEKEPEQKAEPAETSETEAQVPENIRKALQEITDPAVRKRLADDHFRLRRWNQIGSQTGMKVSEISEYLPAALKIAPTVDVLDHMGRTAEVANALVADFNEGGPESLTRFAEAQFKINPRSFVKYNAFLLGQYDTMQQGLRQLDPELAREQQKAADSFVDSRVRNLLANLRKSAKTPGQEIHGEAADVLEEYLGWDKKKAAEPSEPDPRDAEIARLKAERERAAQARVEAFEGSVANATTQTLKSQVTEFVTGLTAGYPPKAVEKICAQIDAALFKALETNPHILARADGMKKEGRYDRDHHDKMVSFFIESGRKLLPNVARPILDDWRETLGPARAKQQARVEQHTKKRDIGASGAPPSPKVEPPPSGKNPKALFDYLDRVSESRR